VTGRDPNKFPVPVAGSIPPGGSATVEITVDATGSLARRGGVVVTVTAGGGRASTDIKASLR
jgi:rhamnogalacturonan endolyase